MKPRHSIAAHALIALFIASVGAAEEPPTAEWNTGWAQADAPGLAALYTEDARMMTPNVPAVVGRKEIQAMFTRMVGRKMTITSTVVEDFESGDLWVRRADYEMLFAGQHIDDGEAVELWRNIDGRWRLHLQIFTSRNIRPIAYDDPAPEWDNFKFVPAPTPADEPEAAPPPVDPGTSLNGESASAEDDPPGN